MSPWAGGSAIPWDTVHRRAIQWGVEAEEALIPLGQFGLRSPWYKTLRGAGTARPAVMDGGCGRLAPPLWGPTSTPQGVWGTHGPQPGSTEAASSPASQPIHQQPACCREPPAPPGPSRPLRHPGGQVSRTGLTISQMRKQTSSARIGAVPEPQHAAAGARQGAHRSERDPRYGLASALLHGCTCPWRSFGHDPHVSFEGLSGNEDGLSALPF